eukprot:5016099-Pyramimonas_sp.AAC.1
MAWRFFNRVNWNLCNFEAERDEYGVPQLCWFEEGQFLLGNQGQELYEFEVKAGTWYLHVEGDFLGILGGQVRLLLLSRVSQTEELDGSRLDPRLRARRGSRELRGAL